MDLSPKRVTGVSADSHEWATGFQLYASSGTATARQCDTCAALVRQDPGSAKRHREWYGSVGESS